MEIAYSHELGLIHTHLGDGVISFAEGIIFYLAIIILIAIGLVVFKCVIAKF